VPETYTATFPDGRVVSKQVPDGATDEQVRRAFQSSMKALGVNTQEQEVQRPPIPRSVQALGMSEPEQGYGDKARMALMRMLEGAGLDGRTASRWSQKLGDLVSAVTPAGNIEQFLDADSDFDRQLSMLPLPGPARQAIKQGIRAWHGSPHDFDRFDLSRVGKGGGQAQGHGIYLTEDRGFAENVRDNLTRGHNGYAESALAEVGGDLDRAIADTQEMMAQFPGKYENELAALLARRDGGQMRGRLYEAEVNADPGDFLDWDEPVGEIAKQIDHPLIRAWEESGALPHVTGSTLYKQMAGGLTQGAVRGGEAARTSRMLSALGVPGIKYIDHGVGYSRPSTRNYVVFDDSLIDIVNKY
jgi:hypothetical protein